MGNGKAQLLTHEIVQKRTGFYLVRTDVWYIERAVWMIAGVSVLAGSLLARFQDSKWALLITVTAVFSILTGTSGYCVVGNILKCLGMRGLLDEGSCQWYRMQTDSWYIERRIYLIVGLNLTVGSMLVMLHSPWWGLYTGFVGAASLVFGLSGFCIMAHVLWKRGKEPRIQKQ